jgi:O-antigen biosynthesis protein
MGSTNIVHQAFNSSKWMLLRNFKRAFLNNSLVSRKFEIDNKSYKSIRKYVRIFLTILALPLVPFFFFKILILKLRYGKNSLTFSSSNSMLSFRTTEKVIIILAPIDWHFRIQRPQQLAIELSKLGHRVIYVNPSIKNVSNYRNPFVEIIKGVTVLDLHWNLDTRYIGVAGLTESEAFAIRRQITDFLETNFFNSCTIIVQQPAWTELVGQFASSQIIFDCMDLHQGFNNIHKAVIENESKLLTYSHKVVVTSDILQNNLISISNKTPVIIRNGCSPDHFDQLGSNNHQDVYVGYFGAIAEWFDAKLLRQVAESLPNIKFELIGNVTSEEATSLLSDLPNISFLGEVPYDSLRNYIGKWSVGIIPFKLDPLILATNPVKLYEYSAAGLPTVATSIPEVKKAKLDNDLIGISENAQEFVANITKAIQNKKDWEQKLISWSKLHTWSNRALEISNLIETEPLVSIIILMWNNSKMTIKCLSSVLSFSDYNNLEIIVVDNGSEQYESAIVKKWITNQNDTRIRLIRNNENLGFAAGNNIGVEKSAGEYIVLLNNDTEVTVGWIWRALRHFQNNIDIGLLGPTTNNCGNEARVILESTSSHWRSEVNEKFEFSTPNLIQSNMVAFFCVFIPRKIVEIVGLLDPIYGIGYFEDDDYCERVKLAGYKPMIARDIFVFHHMGASFDILSINSKNEMWEKNKKIFEKKWGKWQIPLPPIESNKINRRS